MHIIILVNTSSQKCLIFRDSDWRDFTVHNIMTLYFIWRILLFWNKKLVPILSVNTCSITRNMFGT